MTVHTVLVEKHTVQMYIVLIDVLFMSNYECYVVSLIPVLQSLTPPIYAIVPKLAHFGKHFLPLLWLVLTYQFPKSAAHSLYSLDVHAQDSPSPAFDQCQHACKTAYMVYMNKGWE